MAVPVSNDTCAPLVTGGYDCDFVDPPPDSLQCPVCLLPFRDPHLLSCCGHKGCASCIGRIKAASHLCPICQQPFETMLDKQYLRKVLDLRVFCSKKGEGCCWQGELRDLETHSRRGCNHVQEDCRYGCGGRYQRRLLRDHEMDECPQRPPEIVTQSLIRKLDKAHCEDHAKLNQQIQQLQKDNGTLRKDLALMQEEKGNLVKKLDELEDEVECLSTDLRSQIVVAQS